MVPEIDIPPNVVRFVMDYIDTVPQLETLLMMNRSRDRDWTVAEVAAHNYITLHRADETLAALRRRSLVSNAESTHHFRFSPATQEIADLVDELARCYQVSLSRIATLIHSKPSASVTEFARAFDLKKDH
jgi:hypothetical protein